jgi:hypothetical protein
MGLDLYVTHCDALACELRDSLAKTEVVALRERLANTAKLEWMRWRVHNEKLIAEFVAATPAQRKRMRKFEEDRLLLTLAGIQHCMEAYALLRVMDNNPLSPGQSYRSMAAVAGVAYQQLFDIEIPHWPFDGSSSPFKE